MNGSINESSIELQESLVTDKQDEEALKGSDSKQDEELRKWLQKEKSYHNTSNVVEKLMQDGKKEESYASPDKK